MFLKNVINDFETFCSDPPLSSVVELLDCTEQNEKSLITSYEYDWSFSNSVTGWFDPKISTSLFSHTHTP